MEFNAFKQTLRNDLINGQPQQAIERLLEIYDKIGGESQDEVIVLAGRLKRLRDREIAGVLSTEEVDRQTNTIKYNLLQLIDQLHQDPAIANHFGLVIPKTNTKSSQNPTLTSSRWFILGGIVLTIAILFYVFNLPQKADMIPDIAIEETKEQPEEDKKVIDHATSTIVENTKTNNPIKQPDRKTPERKIVATPEIEETVADDKSRVRIINPELPIVRKTEAINEAIKKYTKENPGILSLNTPLESGIATGIEADFYQIQLARLGRLTILITPKSTDLRARVNIFDDRGNRILQSTAAEKGAIIKETFTTQRQQYNIKLESYLKTTGNYMIEAYFE